VMEKGVSWSGVEAAGAVDCASAVVVKKRVRARSFMGVLSLKRVKVLHRREEYHWLDARVRDGDENE
jgi:hypothetical protein